MFDIMIGISQQELTHDKVTRHMVVPCHMSRAACLSLVKDRNIFPWYNMR